MILPTLPPGAVAEFYFLNHLRMWPHQAREISITHENGVAKCAVIDPVAKHPFRVSRDYAELRAAFRIMTTVVLVAVIAGLVLAPLLIWLMIRLLIPLLKSPRP